MTEQGHEVVCHDDEIATGLRCPEVVRHEVVYREIVLELLDPVLGVGPAPVRVIYNLGGQCKIRDEAAVSVFPEILLIPKKLELPDLLARCLRPLLNLLPYHDDTPRTVPMLRLVSGFRYFQTVCHLHPCLLMRQAVLDAVVEPAGYDVAQLPLFQIPEYVPRKETAVHADESHSLVLKP